MARAVDSRGRQPAGLADARLGMLLSSAASPYRRNYLGLQLMNGGDAKSGWVLRYTLNLDDGSGEAVVLLKRDIGNQVQVWATLMSRQGDRASEYGRWVRSSSMVGVTWFMW